jgi:hypothetical protein
MRIVSFDETGVTAVSSLSPDSETCPLERSVPPTGMRLTKILGQFRIHARSIGHQIGPDALRDFVEEVIRQDLQEQPGS